MSCVSNVTNLNSENSVQAVSTVLSLSLMVFFLNVCLCTSQWCWVKSCWSLGKKRLSVFLDCCWPITSFLYLPPCINISFLISFSLLISSFLCFYMSWLFHCYISLFLIFLIASLSPSMHQHFFSDFSLFVNEPGWPGTKAGSKVINQKLVNTRSFIWRGKIWIPENQYYEMIWYQLLKTSW